MEGRGGGCRLLNLNPFLKSLQYARIYNTSKINNMQDLYMPLIPFLFCHPLAESSTDQSEVGLLRDSLLLVHLQLDLLVHCVQALQYL